MANSHIQIPNAILKCFRDFEQSDGRVWYLDIDKGKVLRKASGKLGTSKGYYSDDMEGYLSTSVESPISQLNRKIDAFSSGIEQTISISPKDQITLKDYIKSAISRSDMFHKTFCENSITAPFSSDQNNHDSVVYYSMNTHGSIDDLLKNFNMTVLVNESVRPLVVPRNCFYFTKSLGSSCIVAPVSPIGALILLPKDYCFNYQDGQSLIFAKISDAQDIESLNFDALVHEYLYNKSFVASNSKAELESLSIFLSSKRFQLEEMRKSFYK